MRSLSARIVLLCASPLGVVVLAALDSTLVFSLPLGIDAAVVILAARLAGAWWIVPLLAASGSIVGAALTFWMGAKIGEKGLERHIARRRLERIRSKIRKSGAVALAVLDLIPPPFPFTPFVLAAGALEVKPSVFFVTLAFCRLLRFGAEAAVAQTYGRHVIALIESDLFHDIASFFIALAAILTILSALKLFRPPGPARHRTAA